MTTRFKTLIHKSSTSILRLALPGALVLMNVCQSRALAQDAHAHSPATQKQAMTSGRNADAGALLKIVRDSTERFKDVSVARRRAMPCNSAV